MSAELQALNKERTMAKAGITRAVKRISDGISRHAMSLETLKVLVNKLETLYNDFLDISESYSDLCTAESAPIQYTTVNNLTLRQYEDSVEAKYLEGKQAFGAHIVSGEFLARNPPSAPSTYLKKTRPTHI